MPRLNGEKFNNDNAVILWVAWYWSGGTCCNGEDGCLLDYLVADAFSSQGRCHDSVCCMFLHNLSAPLIVGTTGWRMIGSNSLRWIDGWNSFGRFDIGCPNTRLTYFTEMIGVINGAAWNFVSVILVTRWRELPGGYPGRTVIYSTRILNAFWMLHDITASSSNAMVEETSWWVSN